MINAINQSFVANTSNTIAQNNKDLKTNQAQKAENDKLERIAQQLKNGEYKIDLKATAEAITESLI